ncbi:MAG: SDR family oxidoreductase [Actinomycetota bacterium]|nr:SDR family oxidoreductase [Actinomycetota bacterium]
MPTALITGATAGIGRGFVDEFARRGFDLVLVARDEERLTALSDECFQRHGVRCEVLPADLAVRADVDRVAARAADPSRPVSALVNNAGFGLNAAFLAADVDDEQRMLDVLVVAVMRLTHAAVPGMVERRSGMVINVSSVAAWVTGGTYSAAKAWVTSFSEGLAQEVGGTGVRVVAVCPGFTHTQFHERAGIDMSTLPEWMWLDVPRVVDQAMRDLARGRPVSVAGPQYKAISGILRHAPRSVVRLATASRRRNPRFARD